jgi:hypothetical protein
MPAEIHTFPGTILDCILSNSPARNDIKKLSQINVALKFFADFQVKPAFGYPSVDC